jgi:hypothetical protein
MEETVMRLSFTITAAAASLVMLTAAANAQYMERRDLLDPFGRWSGYEVNQNQIFSPGPPSKTGAHFGPRYSNDNNFGYPSWMPGRL